MKFKGNAISTPVIKQFKPAYFPFYTKALWDKHSENDAVTLTDHHQMLPQHKPSAWPGTRERQVQRKYLCPPMKRLEFI